MMAALPGTASLQTIKAVPLDEACPICLTILALAMCAHSTGHSQGQQKLVPKATHGTNWQAFQDQP